MQPVFEPRVQMRSTGMKGGCGGSLSQERGDILALVPDISGPLVLTASFVTCQSLSLFTERGKKSA